MTTNARLLAFYLPQFHPIPENDMWWGRGFTEWTNVAKGRPLFRGHYQPRLPTDLGFYDLRVAEVREAQAELARDAGIEGFAYYHYWFGGKRLLERPFVEVVASGRPNFPFCLCWANQTWSGIWHGAPDRVLIEQTYPGKKDNEQHFLALLDAFHDPRYVRVDGKPVFVIYRPLEIPDVSRFLSQWRELAAKHGLPGMYFVAHLLPFEMSWDHREQGFDGAVIVNSLKAFTVGPEEILRRRMTRRDGSSEKLAIRPLTEYVRNRVNDTAQRALGGFRNMVRYEDALLFFLDWSPKDAETYPCVTPNWDNTPRSGYGGVVLHDSTPELFAIHLRQAIAMVSNRLRERRLIFVKSWNEWAEGNYLEPDERFGHQYLDVIRKVLAETDG
jgi:lipopolysaccharide biosynthesis protein